MAPGVHLNASVWVSWEDLVAADDSEAIQLWMHYYLDDAVVSSESLGISYPSWPATSHTEPPPTDWTKIAAALLDGTGFTVPPGVNRARLGLKVTADATAGQVWFDTVELFTTDPTEAIAYKDFITTCDFTKVRCTFTDSGVVRSNAMWARQDPLDTNISATALAYYTSTIPDVIPAGMWADTFAGWGSPGHHLGHAAGGGGDQRGPRPDLRRQAGAALHPRRGCRRGGREGAPGHQLHPVRAVPHRGGVLQAASTTTTRSRCGCAG